MMRIRIGTELSTSVMTDILILNGLIFSEIKKL